MATTRISARLIYQSPFSKNNNPLHPGNVSAMDQLEKA